MYYTTILAHLDISRPNQGPLRIAGLLAERFEAGVLGVATCAPLELADTAVYTTANIYADDLELREAEIKRTEAEFRGAMSGYTTRISWHGSMAYGPLSTFVVEQARNAELIVTGIARGPGSNDRTRIIDRGQLVMAAGRPVLLVPPDAENSRLERAIILWKDTREARRATLDALPLLEKMKSAVVVEMITDGDLEAGEHRVGEVTAWLRRHGVAAEGRTLPIKSGDFTRMRAIIREQEGDLVVAGAYGHTRLREWLFGGVTRELLSHGDHCMLLSH